MLETVKTFTALSEEFVEESLRLWPVRATEVGIHDYDRLLPDDTPDGFRARAAWLRDLDQRLAASVPWEELPVEHRVDYALLRSRITVMRADLEEIRTHARDPVTPVQTALDGVFLLAERPFAPLEERKEAIIARLMAIPDYLEAACAGLEQVPEVWVGLAAEVAATGPGFVGDVVRMLLQAFPGEAERVEHAGLRARSGLAAYQERLERDLAPRAGGSFALGARWFDFRLEREHMLPIGCDALEAMGREHVSVTRRLLEAEAARLDPARSWREQVEESRRRHPEARHLREAYVAEVERARRFVLERGLAPVPEVRLEIADTPPFERAVLPYAAYLPPAPFDVEPVGTFFVTPVDSGRRPELQKEQLRDHNFAKLSLVTVHEAWPGHHLQLSHAIHCGSRLRRLAQSSLLSEGWALYVESLMADEGFYRDATARLWVLKGLLWRACRVVVDVGLHTGRMSFAQAVDYLVEEAMLERSSAIAEVKRHTLTPTQPMSYLVGKLQILQLREEAKHRLGARFNPLDFHAALLASGTLPIALVTEEIWARLGVD